MNTPNSPSTKKQKNLTEKLNIYSSRIKYYDIIPLVNPTGTKNCFLNTIVQILYHSDLFRRKLSQINFDKIGEIKKIIQYINYLIYFKIIIIVNFFKKNIH